MERIWLALGSNLAKPLKQINIALAFLANLPQSRLISCSSYYRSRPLGIRDQPDFLNIVVAMDTNLTPEIFLDHIQAIELCQGRIRSKIRFEPRTLDIDILLYGNKIINNQRLTIPHYDMYNREFVLYPLAELSPNLRFPDGVLLKEYLYRIPLNGITYW